MLKEKDLWCQTFLRNPKNSKKILCFKMGLIIVGQNLKKSKSKWNHKIQNQLSPKPNIRQDQSKRKNTDNWVILKKWAKKEPLLKETNFWNKSNWLESLQNTRTHLCLIKKKIFPFEYRSTMPRLFWTRITLKTTKNTEDLFFNKQRKESTLLKNLSFTAKITTCINIGIQPQNPNPPQKAKKAN